MDITPLIPQSRKIITGYGGGGFKINHEFVAGSLLIFPERVLTWDGNMEALLSLLPSPSGRGQGEGASAGIVPHPNLLPEGEGIELLLLGTGATILPLDSAIRSALKANGIATDIMNTGATCRTYNVLMSEERRVAAAVIAI